MRLWVITYDIADNRRRRELAKLLSQRLERVQESVFEGWLNFMEIREVIAQVEQIIEPEADKVRAYPLAVRNEKRYQFVGLQMTVPRPQHYWIIG
jgi:CRISPR-associated protein Cas2